MPRRRKEHDPERLGDEVRRRDGNHSKSRVSSRRRRHHSFDTRTFPDMLASAVLDKDEKHPLYTVEKGGKKTIRLRTLQHMIVCNLRRDLAGQVKAIYDENSADDMENIRKTMKHYVCALRDLGYMLEDPSRDGKISDFLTNQLFITTPGDEITPDDLAIMIDAGFSKQYNNSDLDLRVPQYTGHGGKKQAFKEFLKRLRMALFGGFSLITPMLIMSLHSTRVTKLVTSSVFVLVAGLILAWLMKDARDKDIWTATAAYAAVLVVFVGGP